MSDINMNTDTKRGSFWIQLLDTTLAPIPRTKKRVSINDNYWHFNLKPARARVIGGVRIICGKDCNPFIAGRCFDRRCNYDEIFYVDEESVRTGCDLCFTTRTPGDPLLELSM